MKTQGIQISNPYHWKYFYKRMFFFKRFLGPAIDHKIVVSLGDKCVETLTRDGVGLFSHVEIETINRCNFSCSFCPVNKNADKRDFAEMSDSVFERIVGGLAELSYSGRIALHSNNEPLLDQNIVERVRHAKASCPEAYVFLYTNGTLLNTAKALALIEAGIDQIRIDNYNDNLELLANLKKLVVDFSGPEHQEHADKIVIFLRKINEVLSSRGGEAPNKSAQTHTSYQYYQDASCRFPFTQLVIRPDGKVSLCCNDAYGKVTMGDVMRQTLSEIWFGEEFAALRTELMTVGRKRLGICNTCDVHSIDSRVLLADSLVLRVANRLFRFSSWNWK